MHKRIKLTLFISLAALLVLSACSGDSATQDWKVFTIEQEPGFNIQFRLPPRWLVDFAPTIGKPGQWDIVLIPPKCTPDQEMEYQQNCVTLFAHIKGPSTFSKEAFLDLTSGDISLSPDGSQTAKLIGRDSFRVNRLKVEEFNHLLTTSLGDVEMSTYFFETDSAYFTFITNLPYGAPESEINQNFDLLLRSVEKTK
jgi:hypothetical protein